MIPLQHTRHQKSIRRITAMKLRTRLSAKHAVLLLIAIAILLTGLVLLAGTFYRAETFGENGSVGDNESRLAYLAKHGWECEKTPISEEKVLLPAEFDETLERYNLLQRQQGFDLSDYAGLYVMQYRYHVINYPNNDNVEATLYLYEKTVIGGDIHSVALDGFMHSLK